MLSKEFVRFLTRKGRSFPASLITYKPIVDELPEDVKNVKWDGDEEWLSFYPTGYSYDWYESSWDESEGGDHICINEYGLLVAGKDANVEELNTDLDDKEFANIVIKNKLANIFGYTEADFENINWDKINAGNKKAQDKIDAKRNIVEQKIIQFLEPYKDKLINFSTKLKNNIEELNNYIKQQPEYKEFEADGEDLTLELARYGSWIENITALLTNGSTIDTDFYKYAKYPLRYVDFLFTNGYHNNKKSKDITPFINLKEKIINKFLSLDWDGVLASNIKNLKTCPKEVLNIKYNPDPAGYWYKPFPINIIKNSGGYWNSELPLDEEIKNILDQYEDFIDSEENKQESLSPMVTKEALNYLKEKRMDEDMEDDFEFEEKENIDKPYNDGLNVGDHVVIKGLAEDSPWEGLEGEVIWIDEEDFGDDFQTITVRVNFPTENGVKEINQNFDRRNVIKSEAPVEDEEPVEEPEPEPEPRPTEEPDLYDSANEGLDEKYDNGFFILKKKDTGEFLCFGNRGSKWATPFYYLDKNDDEAKIFNDDDDLKRAFKPNKYFASVNDNAVKEGELKPEDFERIYYSVTNSSANESLKNGRIESREDAIIDKLIARLRNDYGLEGRYLYDACLDAGMTEEEVKAFVISPEEFGENLNENEDKDMEEKEKVEIEAPVEAPVEEPEAEVETEVEVEPEEPIEEPEIEEPAPEEEKPAEEEPVEEPTEEKPEEKPVQTIELPHEEYTEPEDIKRINDELGIKAQEGKVLGIRKEDNMLLLAEPEINGIWAIYLNEEGYIKKIVLF